MRLYSTRPLKHVVAILIVVFSSSCSPSVEISDNFKPPNHYIIAILPTKAKGDIPREQPKYLSSLLRQSLSEKKYLLLNEQFIEELCKKRNCYAPDTTITQEGLPADAIAKLEISETSSHNLVGAYFSSVSGELNIEKTTRDPLYSASFTARERGGILFNTGQIIKGISEQIKQFGSTVEQNDNLTFSLIQRLTEAVPAPPERTTALKSPTIENITLTPSADNSKITLCTKVSATTPVLVYGVINKRRAQLRKRGNSLYCQQLRADVFTSTKPELTIESVPPIGLPSVQKKDISPYTICQSSIKKEKKDFIITAEGASKQCKSSTIELYTSTPNEGSISLVKQGRTSLRVPQSSSERYFFRTVSSNGIKSALRGAEVEGETSQ